MLESERIQLNKYTLAIKTITKSLKQFNKNLKEQKDKFENFNKNYKK